VQKDVTGAYPSYKGEKIKKSENKMDLGREATMGSKKKIAEKIKHKFSRCKKKNREKEVVEVSKRTRSSRDGRRLGDSPSRKKNESDEALHESAVMGKGRLQKEKSLKKQSGPRKNRRKNNAST